MVVSGSVPTERIRATNAERENVVERLGRALSEGCVDATEFEDRAGRALAATTRGDLAHLVEDLPPDRPPRATAAARDAAHRHPALRAVTTLWMIVCTVSIGAWVLLGLAMSDFASPWWIWVVGPTGAALTMLWFNADRKSGRG